MRLNSNKGIQMAQVKKIWQIKLNRDKDGCFIIPFTGQRLVCNCGKPLVIGGPKRMDLICPECVSNELNQMMNQFREDI